MPYSYLICLQHTLYLWIRTCWLSSSISLSGCCWVTVWLPLILITISLIISITFKSQLASLQHHLYSLYSPDHHLFPLCGRRRRKNWHFITVIIKVFSLCSWVPRSFFRTTLSLPLPVSQNAFEAVPRSVPLYNTCMHSTHWRPRIKLYGKTVTLFSNLLWSNHVNDPRRQPACIRKDIGKGLHNYQKRRTIKQGDDVVRLWWFIMPFGSVWTR